MRRGFEFDAGLCVACSACSAACTLENGFQQGIRNIYSWNSEGLPLLRVINLSLACNHCEKPACLEGCPAKAYTVDGTGAVIHHQERCMGCGYCTWRCPYDAPKINEAKGFIEKCHLCMGRAAEDIEPACVTSCPTGALRMTELDDFPVAGTDWFPDTGIKPSVKLIGIKEMSGPAIFPSVEETGEEEYRSPVPETKLKSEWSLLIFSLLVIAASALFIATAISDTGLPSILPAIMLTGALIISFAHLGVPARAWRAVFNVISSPLSRELIMLILLTVLAYMKWLRPGMLHPFVPAVAALATLISVDLVYFAADRSAALKLHSGQAFFSGTFIATWFIFPETVFLVFSLLAATSVITRYKSAEKGGLIQSLYYFRALSIPLVFLLLYPGSDFTTAIAEIVFLAGIAADRALFFDDFNPVNIKQTISEHFYHQYEKERDKQREDTGIS